MKSSSRMPQKFLFDEILIKYQIDQPTFQNSKNLLYYLNLIKNSERGYYIQEHHKKFSKNYPELEKNHFYIQWWFPNLNKSSAFNSHSVPMSYLEANIFTNEKLLAEKILTSYEIMLDFYGLELDRLNGDLKKSAKYIKRITAGLIDNKHNHLRITRILGFLSICGFRTYARKLIDFFEVEIYSPYTFEEYTSLYSKDTKINKNLNGTLKLLHKEMAFRIWSLYSTKNECLCREMFLAELLADNRYQFQPSIYFSLPETILKRAGSFKTIPESLKKQENFVNMTSVLFYYDLIPSSYGSWFIHEILSRKNKIFSIHSLNLIDDMFPGHLCFTKNHKFFQELKLIQTNKYIHEKIINALEVVLDELFKLKVTKTDIIQTEVFQLLINEHLLSDKKEKIFTKVLNMIHFLCVSGFTEFASKIVQILETEIKRQKKR